MFYKSLIIIFLFSGLFIFSGVNTALAYDFADDTGLKNTAGGAGYETGDTETIDSKIGIIIKAALSFLGVIFLILMIYGGFLWMTAKGNEEQVVKARNLISAAIIGLIIVASAYAISYFIVSNAEREALKLN